MGHSVARSDPRSMELKFRRGHPSTQVTQGTSSTKERKIMINRRVEIERFSVVSSKPF